MIYVIFVLQIICILATGIGIYVEVTMGADLGYILITGAAMLFAISTKLVKFKLIAAIKEIVTNSKT